MKLNAFDGKKVLYHVAKWSDMERGHIPPPVLVTLDPIHQCNLNCQWCNSSATIDKSGESYSEEIITKLPKFLREWGVKAVCIAGGGEPTLHHGLPRLIEGLYSEDVEVGIVTNGTKLLNAPDALLNALGYCRWVGVSVDAGTAETYHQTKGVDRFQKVVAGMTKLRKKFPGLEITYKYLIYPHNILEMPHAAKIANDIGCTYFHARPAGVTWKDIVESPTKKTYFTRQEVELGVRLLNVIAENSWRRVKVVNTPGKFDGQTWAILHEFSACHAVGMTCAIQANGTVSLCCDRRGDKRVELCEWTSLNQICEGWGSPHHQKILASINLKECPRCTYAPHNNLYEAFVTRDDTCKDFI